ncbi:MAG: L-histidine N(alpha)-methyltransferase [Phycisphaerales bacterium]|nr:L-histidine N(alpha)-methyltransferase [Phycisphaerales bacterium]
MRIFVGCASESKARAEEVATALESQGFVVMRWWNDPDAFPGGANTLARLIELSNECDGAAFVFGEDDDVTIIDDSGAKLTQKAPRDNVILEYGIFVSKLGPLRTQYLVESGVKVPSDLNGIQWCSAHDEIPKLVASLRKQASTAHHSDLSSRVHLHASRRLILNVSIPAGWNARAMYLDKAGADAWGALERDPEYSGSKSTQAVAHAISELAIEHELHKFGAAVSFGPGVGLLDQKVLSGYIGQELQQYIPIDINLHLALTAADLLDGSRAGLQVPFCISADFEEEMGPITQMVNSGARGKRLYLMLGGTFGNLEKGEDGFLCGLRECMQAKDVAILDVSIARPKYEIGKDPYRVPSRQRPTVKGFLASGVARRLNLNQRDVEQAIQDHVEFCASHTSNIRDTPEFMFRCKAGHHPLIYVRRYRFDDLKQHLKSQGFIVLDARSVGDPNDTKHRGIYFLRKE